MERLTGTVVWFNDKRGFGFIGRDDGGKDLFCHYTNIVAEQGKFKTPTAGSKVEFSVGANDTGPQAEEVVVTEAAPPAEDMYHHRAE